MKVITKAVLNMETMQWVSEESYSYNGPWALADSPSRSPIEKTATDRSTADQAKENQLVDTSQGTLGQFEGPVTSSPFYHELLTAGTDATADAYNNAASKQRKNENTAGFNYAQPAVAGESNELAGQEAKQLSSLPTTAAIEATQPALAAAGETARTGTTIGGQGEGYFTGGAVPLENQYQQDQGSFWNSLFGLPATIGKSVIEQNPGGVFD